MEMEHGDHGMEGMMAPPNHGGGHNMSMGHHSMMHMTFFWGKDALVLFDDWPAGKTGSYAMALILVFVMSMLVEVLSRTRFIKRGNVVATSLIQTLVHAFRVGVSYLVMLALMSFNGGIFLAAVLGHALGFLLWSPAFQKPNEDREASHLPHC